METLNRHMVNPNKNSEGQEYKHIYMLRNKPYSAIIWDDDRGGYNTAFIDSKTNSMELFAPFGDKEGAEERALEDMGRTVGDYGYSVNDMELIDLPDAVRKMKITEYHGC